MMAVLNVPNSSMQPSLPMQKPDLEPQDVAPDHTTSTKQTPEPKVPASPLKIKFRAFNQGTALSHNSRLSLDTNPSPVLDSSSAEKHTLPTSPGSNPLSQSSISSQNARSPSTAASSVFIDDEVQLASPSGSANKKPNVQSTKPNPPSIDDFRSRSPSVMSFDGVGRVSGRARKPTTKALALADAGTRFYRSLQKPSEEMVQDNEAPPDDIIVQNGELDVQLINPDGPNEEKDQQPPDLVLSSVEEPISVAVRNSPRQRKPTAKAAASEVELSTRKRTASPSDSGWSKVIKLNLNVPREPSKLRKSLSTVTEDAKPQIHLAPHSEEFVQPTQSERMPVFNVLDGLTERDQAPNTTEGIQTADSVPVQISQEMEDATPGQSKDLPAIDHDVSMPESHTSHATCNLSCLSPVATLLAFARFAADDDSDSDEDNEAGDDVGLTSKTDTNKKQGAPSMDIVKKIAKAFCQCNHNEHVAKCHSDHSRPSDSECLRNAEASAPARSASQTSKPGTEAQAEVARCVTLDGSRQMRQRMNTPKDGEDHGRPLKRRRHNPRGQRKALSTALSTPGDLAGTVQPADTEHPNVAKTTQAYQGTQKQPPSEGAKANWVLEMIENACGKAPAGIAQPANAEQSNVAKTTQAYQGTQKQPASEGAKADWVLEMIENAYGKKTGSVEQTRTSSHGRSQRESSLKSSQRAAMSRNSNIPSAATGVSTTISEETGKPSLKITLKVRTTPR